MADGLHQFFADYGRILLGLLALVIEYSGPLFHELALPTADQRLMNFELGGKFGELFLALDRRYGDLELKFLAVVIPRTFCQILSPS